MPPSDSLKASLTQEERQAAAAIGESVDLSPNEKVSQLFETLGDPLLSAQDACHLLAEVTSLQDIQTALTSLTDSGFLEKSIHTQRPLDHEPDLPLYRRAGVAHERLKLVALESRAPDGSVRLHAACDGRLIRSIAWVDRLDAVSGTGQQREEIQKHVERIAGDLTEGTQIPNSLLLVLLSEYTVDEDEVDDETPSSFIIIRELAPHFEMPDPSLDGAPIVQDVRLVEVDLPFRRAAFDEEKVALLVDGQQRTAAISLVPIDKVPAIEVSFNAIVADDDESKRIFTLANSSQPIKKELSRALTATMEDASGFLKEDRLEALALQQVAVRDNESPFFDRVKYPGFPKSSNQVATYNTVFHAIKAFTATALPVHEDPNTLAHVIKRAFKLVEKHWPEAWGARPSFDARLMHGLGLRSMAQFLAWRLEIYSAGRDLEEEHWEQLDDFLNHMKVYVVWTQSKADQAPRSVHKFWDTFIRDGQNTNQDIAKLFNEMRKKSPQIQQQMPSNL